MEEIVENKEEAAENFGKFKKASELKKAYENLEQEFTRKSQKIKELEKLVESLQNSTESAPDSCNFEHNAASASANAVQSTEPPQAVFEQDDWPVQVAKFAEQNKYAKDYAKEISSEILENPALSLEAAWARVAGKHFTSKNDLIEDENFLNDYVYKNDKVKQKIIDDFIKSNHKSYVPTLIASAGNSGFTVTKKTAPKSFDEAKAEAEKLFG